MATLRARVLGGQVWLYGWLAVTIALWPGLVLKRHEVGLSQYGLHQRTAPTYALAYLGCALLSWNAAALSRTPWFTRLLRLYGTLLVLALLSTFGYQTWSALHLVHELLGAALLVFEPVATGLLLRHRGPSCTALAAGLAAGVGSVLAVLDVARLWPVLFAAQTCLGVGFALALARALNTAGADPLR